MELSEMVAVQVTSFTVPFQSSYNLDMTQDSKKKGRKINTT